MMRRTLIILCAMTLVAFRYPSAHDLTVDFNVRLERASGGLSYLYKVASHRSSRQTVYIIAMENHGTLSNLLTPLIWKIKGDYLDNEAGDSDMVRWFPGRSRNDPSGIESPPINSIEPGQTSPEFGILSNPDPPGITKYRVKGWAPVPIMDEERGVLISDGVEYNMDDWADTIMDHHETIENAVDNAVIGYTLGPRTPLADPCRHLLQLVGEVNQAADLGWIGPADRGPRGRIVTRAQNGPLRSIVAKLAAARASCMRGQTEAACNQLRALLHHVEARRGKTLTEEAYYLIKYNVEYLRDKFECARITLAGKVRDTRGSPISGAVITLRFEQDDDDDNDEKMADDRTCTSNPAGEFVFADVLPGEAKIRAEAIGFESTSGGKDIKEGINRITVVMERAEAGAIKVHVRRRNARGEQVNAQGIDVTITGPLGSSAEKTYTAKTGWGSSSGEARFQNLIPGKYRINALDQTREALVESGKTANVRFE